MSSVSPNFDPKNDIVCKPVGKLRTDLLDAGWDVGADTPPSVLEELYDVYLTKKSIGRFRDVRPDFPVLSPCDFLTNAKKILEFKWKDGGRLIADNRLSIDMVSELSTIFATLVTFSTKRHTRFDHRVYRAVPTWFLDIANGCRYMEGFRLIKRMLRHCMDSKIPTLIATIGSIYNNEDELCILVKNVFHASRRGMHYPAGVAFPKDKI